MEAEVRDGHWGSRALVPATDRARLLGLMCYFVLGMGFLAPWNAFVTAIDYFAAIHVSPYHTGIARHECMTVYAPISVHGSMC